MNRAVENGLNQAGIRRRKDGGSAARSARSQRRAREKAVARAIVAFRRETGLAPHAVEARAHPAYAHLRAELTRIDQQVLVP